MLLKVFLLGELSVAFAWFWKRARNSNVAIFVRSGAGVDASNSIAPEFSLGPRLSEKARRIALLFRLLLLGRFRFPLTHVESTNFYRLEQESTIQLDSIGFQLEWNRNFCGVIFS